MKKKNARSNLLGTQGANTTLFRTSSLAFMPRHQVWTAPLGSVHIAFNRCTNVNTPYFHPILRQIFSVSSKAIHIALYSQLL